jgi:hypothetical protein
MRGSCVLALAATLVAWPAISRADDATCIDASEKSISLRREGKLHDALKVLASCSDPACPAEVKEECAKRIAKIDEAMPTLVLVAKSSKGEDVPDVSVTLDGSPLALRVDGRPLSLDPGSHTFVLTAKGQPPVERTLLLREGEKNRQELVRIGPEPAPPPPPPRATPPVNDSWGGQKIAGVVIAGVGVLGLGLGGTFGALAMSEQKTEQNDCSSSSCKNPSGARSAYDRASTDATVSTVSFIAGGALVAGGAVLFFLAKPAASATTTTGSLRLAPAVDAHHQGLVLGGEF